MGAPNFKPDEISSIRKLHAEGKSQTEIAALLNRSASGVGRILSGARSKPKAATTLAPADRLMRLEILVGVVRAVLDTAIDDGTKLAVLHSKLSEV